MLDRIPVLTRTFPEGLSLKSIVEVHSRLLDEVFACQRLCLFEYGPKDLPFCRMTNNSKQCTINHGRLPQQLMSESFDYDFDLRETRC
jgi:hypothetical protein